MWAGQRVRTPEGGSGDTAIVPEHWRQYDVQLLDEESGWDKFKITLLRPAGWLKQHSRHSGTEVWIDLEELNAHGWAQVVRESACPAIAPGPGRVVTATITHRNDDVRTLTLDGGETLHVTGNHRMYSASAQDWVPVKRLRVGEELRTPEGRKSVASLGYQQGRHQVYNLEVEQEHCYFVGDDQVLSHNAGAGCGSDGESPTGGKNNEVADIVERHGGKPIANESSRFEMPSKRAAQQAASEIAGNLGNRPTKVPLSQYRESGLGFGAKTSNNVIGKHSAALGAAKTPVAGFHNHFAGHSGFGESRPHFNAWSKRTGTTAKNNVHLYYRSKRRR